MINDYKKVKECVYKGERYSVRDNGAVMRHLREGMKPRKLDGVWTFGSKNSQNGYMHVGSHRVHIIVATAFYGAHNSKVYVVDHIDTNRCNNRVENLRWLTKLENVINNEITRNKIIAICGSLEAFVENPSILRERLKFVNEPSLEWMRPVTREEVKIAYENVNKFWVEQAKHPKQLVGGKLSHSVYRKRINEDPIGEFEAKYVMSQTPRAVQEIDANDKLFYYPSTPQYDSDNPLKTYYEALNPGKVFWRHHEGKRDYVVEKRDYSIEGNSLVIMTKAGYIWRSDNKGESVEIPLSALSETDYDDRELDRQLYEIVYKNGVYYHIRVERGFHPREYLEDIYKDMTGIES